MNDDIYIERRKIYIVEINCWKYCKSFVHVNWKIRVLRLYSLLSCVTIFMHIFEKYLKKNIFLRYFIFTMILYFIQQRLSILFLAIKLESKLL